MDTVVELTLIKTALDKELSYLRTQNFQYGSYTRKNKLGDKDLYFFVYDQPERQYRFELIYVTNSSLSLRGYLINYKTKEPNHLDFQDYLPFTRLTRLVDKEENTSSTKSSFKISHDIKWAIKVVQNTLAIIETQGWVDYKLLKQKEEKQHDYFEYFYQIGNEWIKDILDALMKDEGLAIVYNSIEYPDYEGEGMVLSNTHGNTFVITLGYRPSATDELENRERLYVIETKDADGCICVQAIHDHRQIIPFCKKVYKRH